MSKNTKDTTVDMDSATPGSPERGQKGFPDHVYDHAGIYILLGKYVGWAADGSRT